MPMLTLKNLSLGYDGKKIIGDVNLSIHAGDYLCIVGENGAGKSTLMKTILGLINPLSGEIILGDGLKKNEIGYLPQTANIKKDFPASVSEIVLSGCQGHMGMRPLYTKEEKSLSRAYMEKMGVLELSGKSFSELSGGQRQRVLLARALLATKKVLLLDEPVAGLDPVVTAQLYSIIKNLNDEGITIIMISHDIDAALRYASHILFVEKKVFFGTKDEFVNSTIGRKIAILRELEEKDGKTVSLS